MSGRVWTVVAGWLGVLAGGAIGAALGFFIAEVTTPPDVTLDGLLNYVWALGVGIWVGASIGAAIGLKLAKSRPTASRIFWSTLLLPVLYLALGLSAAFSDQDDAVDLRGQVVIVVLGVVALVLMAGALSARFGGREAPSRR